MGSTKNPGRHARLLMRRGAAARAGLMLAALFAASCAAPKVVYRQADALDASSLRSASSTSFYFRIPRSQILIRPASGEKRLRPAAIDPLPTETWTALPFNPGLYYRIAVAPDDAGTLSMAEFRARQGRKLKVFPVPSCRTAQIEIAVAGGGEMETAFQKEPPGLTLQAAATEYDYPSEDGTLSLSPLYQARPRRSWFSATRVNVVKYPNTQMVKSLSVEVEDHFAQAITALAGIARKTLGAPRAIPPMPEEFVPVFSSSLTVADNRRVAVAPLPKKGNISLHPVCGADVTEQGSTTALDFLKDAQTAIAQAKELYDVWNGNRRGRH